MRANTSSLLLWAALGCAGPAGAADVTEHSTTRQIYHLSAAGAHTLEVRAISGTITVQGYAGSDVEVQIDKTVTAATQEDVRAADHEVTLDTSADDSLVRAVVRQPHEGVCGEEFHSWSGSWSPPQYHVRFDFTIRVPADTRLTLCTINKGDVAVSGVRGDFWVHSVNGPITLADVGGSGEAVTVNGPITASFATAPHAASLFKTVNGGIILTLPEVASADLQLKTFHGGLYTDFEAQTLPAQAPLTVEKHAGLSVYRSNGFTSVRIGKGGPTLTLDTLNGDVRVLRRSR
jgi:hypothetical protein